MEVFCSPNTTTGCGYGICNDFGTSCACDAGYEHDLTQLFFRNCYLLTSVKLSLFSILGVTSLITCLISIFLLLERKPRGIPRIIFWLVIISNLAESCYILALGLEGRPGISALVFLIILNTVGAGLSPIVVLWSFISPMMEITRLTGHKEILRRRLIFFFIQLVLSQFCVVASLHFQYSGNERMFNLLTACHILYIAFYALVWLFLIMHYSSLLLNELVSMRIKSASLMNPPQGEEDDPIQAHEKKLRNVASFFTQNCISVLIAATTISLLYLCMGVHPYRFIVQFLIIFPFNANSFLLLYFATVTKSSSASSSSSNPTAKQVLNSGGNSNHVVVVASTLNNNSSSKSAAD